MHLNGIGPLSQRVDIISRQVDYYVEPVAQERIKLIDSRTEERGELLCGWRGASLRIRRGEELECREHVRHRQP